MSAPAYRNLREMLKCEEDYRQFPYRCPAGRLTVGYGRNLEARGVTEFESNFMLSEDMNFYRRQAVEAFAWFNLIDVVRQDVIVAMAFQMGIDGVKEFAKMIEALRFNNYAEASREMLDSKWAREQTPSRASRMAEIMLTGKYPG